MNRDPKVGNRRPCTAHQCGKTQTFVDEVVIHPQAMPTEIGTVLVREAGPGWICPDGHREIEKRP